MTPEELENHINLLHQRNDLQDEVKFLRNAIDDIRLYAEEAYQLYGSQHCFSVADMCEDILKGKIP